MGTRPEDLNTNNIQPVGTVVSNEEFDSVYDRPIPYQMNVFARHAGYVGFAMVLRAMGSVTPCENPSTGHYEEPYKEDLFKVGSIITQSGGAGNDMVVALTSDSMYNTNVTQGGSARQASYVLAGDVVEFVSGAQARVTSKNVTVTPHRVTLTPMLDTVDLDDEVDVNGAYHIAYPIFGEGSGAPGVRAPRFVKYANTFGIVKSAWGVTGSEWVNKIYAEPIPGVQGGIRYRLAADALYYHEKGLDGLLLFGTQANNIVTYDASGLNLDVTIAGTEGYIPFAKTSGTTVNPTLATYSTTDLDAIVAVIEDERSTTNNMLLGLTGSTIQRARENGLQEFASQNLAPFFTLLASQSGGWNFDAIADTDMFKGVSYAFGVHHIQKGGIDFNYKKLPIFSDIKRAGAKVAGVATYKYPETTIYQPLGGSVSTNTAKEMPVVGYEYKASAGLNRHMVINQINGAGTKQGMVSHDKDYMQEIITSEIAPHYACGNRIVYEEGA